MKNKLILGMFSLFVLAIIAGCTDIDIHPDGRTDNSDLFTTNRKTYAYLNQCYGWILNYGMNYNYTMLAGCSDEAKDAWELQNGITRQWNEGQLSPFGNPLEGIDGNPENYSHYYQGIRRCNIFLDNIADAAVYSDDIRNSFKAQVLTLRAFYYLQLVKRYGGVPLITTSDYDYSKAQRATFGECALQILDDCQAAINISDVEEWGWRSLDKENYRNVMTKAVCAAIRSEIALYAASPLFNDGTISWQDAAEITKTSLNDCLANGYELYKKSPDAAAGHSPYDVYFYSRSDLPVVNDKETIMEVSGQMYMWNYAGLPTTSGQSDAGACPSQELIDSYETTDGKPVLDPANPYNDDDHLQPNFNSDNTLYNESDPYANRDPRLKASIYYHGSKLNLETETLVSVKEGGNCALNPNNARYTCTGYYTRKFSHYQSGKSGNLDGYFKEFHLAELYLNYAEAANEASTTGIVPNDAVDAVNKIRNRVGMPGIPYGLSCDEFRYRVRNERRVELAFEEHRFFDVRRWKILDQTDKVITGMKVDQNGSYTRFVVDNDRKAYTDKYLLYPIPGDEAIRLRNASGAESQNPGW
jgi:starch-binding outer membrane protein, SusD/RagB family